VDAPVPGDLARPGPQLGLGLRAFSRPDARELHHAPAPAEGGTSRAPEPGVDAEPWNPSRLRGRWLGAALRLPDLRAGTSHPDLLARLLRQRSTDAAIPTLVPAFPDLNAGHRVLGQPHRSFRFLGADQHHLVPAHRLQ